MGCACPVGGASRGFVDRAQCFVTFGATGGEGNDQAPQAGGDDGARAGHGGAASDAGSAREGGASGGRGPCEAEKRGGPQERA
eukprot:24705-Prymnesium_polylepis.1